MGVRQRRERRELAQATDPEEYAGDSLERACWLAAARGTRATGGRCMPRVTLATPVFRPTERVARFNAQQQIKHSMLRVRGGRVRQAQGGAPRLCELALLTLFAPPPPSPAPPNRNRWATSRSR